MSAATATSSPQFARLFPLFGNSSDANENNSSSISALELEALAAVHQFAVAVESIAVSEMLPRTPELIFLNLTTLNGQPYCLELTNKGWRVTSLRSDCMQGDFTRMEMFTRYYDTLHELMDEISPGYHEHFTAAGAFQQQQRRFSRAKRVAARNGNNTTRTSRANSVNCSSAGISDNEENFGFMLDNNNSSTPPSSPSSSVPPSPTWCKNCLRKSFQQLFVGTLSNWTTTATEEGEEKREENVVYSTAVKRRNTTGNIAQAENGTMGGDGEIVVEEEEEEKDEEEKMEEEEEEQFEGLQFCAFDD